MFCYSNLDQWLHCRFFRFPAESRRPLSRRIWIQKINRGDPQNPAELLEPHPKNAYVCSLHFIDGGPTCEHPYPELFLVPDPDRKVQTTFRKKVLCTSKRQPRAERVNVEREVYVSKREVEEIERARRAGTQATPVYKLKKKKSVLTYTEFQPKKAKKDKKEKAKDKELANFTELGTNIQISVKTEPSELDDTEHTEDADDSAHAGDDAADDDNTDEAPLVFADPLADIDFTRFEQVSQQNGVKILRIKPFSSLLNEAKDSALFSRLLAVFRIVFYLLVSVIRSKDRKLKEKDQRIEKQREQIEQLNQENTSLRKIVDNAYAKTYGKKVHVTFPPFASRTPQGRTPVHIKTVARPPPETKIEVVTAVSCSAQTTPETPNFQQLVQQQLLSSVDDKSSPTQTQPFFTQTPTTPAQQAFEQTPNTTPAEQFFDQTPNTTPAQQFFDQTPNTIPTQQFFDQTPNTVQTQPFPGETHSAAGTQPVIQRLPIRNQSKPRVTEIRYISKKTGQSLVLTPRASHSQQIPRLPEAINIIPRVQATPKAKHANAEEVQTIWRGGDTPQATEVLANATVHVSTCATFVRVHEHILCVCAVAIRYSLIVRFQ